VDFFKITHALSVMFNFAKTSQIHLYNTEGKKPSHLQNWYAEVFKAL